MLTQRVLRLHAADRRDLRATQQRSVAGKRALQVLTNTRVWLSALRSKDRGAGPGTLLKLPLFLSSGGSTLDLT